MIKLDMINKNEIRIYNKMFTLENGVLTLELDVQEYDITNKIITASFSMTEVETMPLVVVDNIIQLPIYSNLIKYGLNYIQLNFRWDNKLEQSGKMVWEIDRSIPTTGVAQDSVDIITYLVDIATQAKTDADTALSEANRIALEAGDVRIALDDSVENAITSKVNLDESVVLADDSKLKLDASTDNANAINLILSNDIDGTIKQAMDINSELESSTSSAHQINDILSDSEVGTIKQAIDINQSLDTVIGIAEETKGGVDSSIDEAMAKKTLLDDSITSAININNTIVDPVTGTIKLTTDTRVELEEQIVIADNLKDEIESAIVENQIVTQLEFNQHKLDYVELEREVTKLSYITQRYTIESWQKVQELVRAGLADKAFKVGDQLAATYNGTEFVWDIIGINHDTPSDATKAYSMTIQAHDCIMNCQFDAPQALYYAEAELPAGDYYFINSYETSKAYQFSLANAVPAGGIIFISGWATNSPTQIKTFADNITTTAIETVAIAEGSVGTQLSTINDIRRCQYGSNNYIESNIKQWLNSQDSSFIWDRKTIYSTPSTAAPYTGGGFLNLLDPELVEVIGAVDKQVAKNTVTDGGGQDVFSDKVFLLSRVEVYGGGEGVATGENPYDYYSALASSPTAAEVAGRIKYLGSSARTWWLRSPYPGYSYLPRVVYPTGGFNLSHAYSALGLAPACCIV